MIFASEKMIPWLNKGLDLSYNRHSVLSGNIANADTPGYQSRDVDFTEHLRLQLNSVDNFGPKASAPTPEFREDVPPSLNGNQVDLEIEMVEMTSNRMFYELTFEVISRNFNILRYAIDEGGR